MQVKYKNIKHSEVTFFFLQQDVPRRNATADVSAVSCNVQGTEVKFLLFPVHIFEEFICSQSLQNGPQLRSDTLPLVMLSVLSPLATKSYSATNRLGSFSLGPANRFSLEFQRAASDRPEGSKSGRASVERENAIQEDERMNKNINK